MKTIANPSKNNPKLISGFTLIELLVVFAIIGLITVIIFLGVVGAQQSQRNQERRDTVNRAIAGLNAYQTTNNGQAPTNNYPFNQTRINPSSNGGCPGGPPPGSSGWFCNGLSYDLPHNLSLAQQVDATTALNGGNISSYATLDTLLLYINASQPTGVTCAGNFVSGTVFTGLEGGGIYCISF